MTYSKKDVDNLIIKIKKAFSVVPKPVYWGLESPIVYDKENIHCYNEYELSTQLCKGMDWRTLSEKDLKIALSQHNNPGGTAFFGFMHPIVYHWLMPGILRVALLDTDKRGIGEDIYDYFDFSFANDLETQPERYDIYTADQIEVMADALDVLRERYQYINEECEIYDVCTPKILRLRELASSKRKATN